MNITYTLSPNEYQEAVALHHKSGSRPIIIALYAGLTTFMILFGTDFSNNREIITNILVAFFAIAFYLLFVRMLTVYQANSVYKKSATLPHEVTLHISGKGINPNKQANKQILTWERFGKWKKNKYLYLLYTTPRQFNVIPFRVMEATQREEFEEFLTKYLDKRK